MDWKEVKKAQSMDELKRAKLWLFQENVRIQSEKTEFEEMKDKFIQEKSRYHKDMDTLNRKLLLEQKRLKDENLLFEKKMAILQDGFRKLEDDRKRFDNEKKQYEALKKYEATYKAPLGYINMDEFVGILFRNANSPSSLRKRYRDLMKVFHPDNGGDAELVQLINKEFTKRKEEYY